VLPGPGTLRRRLVGKDGDPVTAPAAYTPQQLAGARKKAALGEAVLDDRGPAGWRSTELPDEWYPANPDFGLLACLGYGGYWQGVDVLFGHLTQEYTQQHWLGVGHGFMPDRGSRHLAAECEAFKAAWAEIFAGRRAERAA
jgi:hypothetical protein